MLDLIIIISLSTSLQYSKAFLKHEDEAKINKRGIWQGEFERPEQWRRKNK